MITVVLALLAFLLTGSISVNAQTTYYTDWTCGSVSTYNPGPPISAGAKSCTTGSATVSPTIKGGIALLKTPGDRLLIRGTHSYSEYLIYGYSPNPILPDGTASNYFVIAAFPGNCFTAGVYGPGGGCESVTVANQSGTSSLNFAANWWRIDGLRFGATNVCPLNASCDQQGMSSNTSTSYVELINSEISGYYSSGLFPGGRAVLRNNKIHDNGTYSWDGVTHCATLGCGTPQDHGIYIHSAGNIIEGNEFYNNWGSGIQAYNPAGSGSATNSIIRWNRIHNNARGQGYAVGITWTEGPNSFIYGNIIYNEPYGSGIEFGCGQANTIVANNTIYNSNQYGIADLYHCGGLTIRNNVSVNSAGYDIAYGSTVHDHNFCDAAGANCDLVNANPGFVSASTFDFRLTSSSYLIDKGVSTGLSCCGVDAAGIARVAPWDLGAYEATGAAVPPPVVTIQGPVATDTYSTTSSTMNLSGIASSSGATVSTVAWSCDRCGGGTTSGTPTSWSVTGITLHPGLNAITVTATDSLSQTGTDSLTVLYTPTFPGNTLAGAWGFGEGSGTTTVDSSGNGNTATLSGTAIPTWTTGKFGNALSFNGLSSFLSIANSNSLAFTQSFTISAWVQPLNSYTDYRGILSKVGYVYSLYATVGGDCGAGGVAGFAKVNGGPNVLLACNATPLQVKTWTHVAVTYNAFAAGGDGFATGGEFKLYKNGVLITTSTGTGLMEPTTGALAIGRTEYDEYFNGVLDEVRLYNWAIPLSSGANTSPGAACGFTSQADRTNMAIVSVIGDMNCPVVASAPPLTIKFPASATGLKLSSGSTFKLGTSP